MSLAPITIFVYNRPWHIRQTVEALRKNRFAKESELFIFSDGPKDERDRKKVEEVRQYLRQITGFKKITIIKRKNNLGLANSIIAGVTEIVNKYGKIIVLEDDLLTSPYFLKFMNEGLHFYEKEEKVASLHAYVYPVKNKLPETFFLKSAGCWGWATWRRGWDLFEPEGKKLLVELHKRNLVSKFDYNNSYPFTNMLKDQIRNRVDSWAIRWYASLFFKDRLTLYPGKSLVFHNGSDGTGTNSSYTPEFDTELTSESINIRKINIVENSIAFNEFSRYFKSIYPPFFLRFAKKCLRKFYSLCRLKKQNKYYA